MTLFKIVGLKQETLATVSCEEFRPVEGKNKFELIGANKEAIGILKLTEDMHIAIVGGIHRAS